MALGITAYSEAAFSSEANDVIAYPQGILLTGSMGEESNTGTANVSVTGIQATITNAGAVAGSSVLVTTTGSQLTTAIGEEDINVGVPITGIQLSITNKTSTQDTLTAFGEAPFATLSPSTFFIPSVTIEATTGAGQLPSFLLQGSVGDSTISGDANVPVIGSELILSTNNVSFEITGDIDVTGSQANISLGTYSVSADGNVSVIVTEHDMFTSIGSVNVAANADVSVTGSQLTGSVGDVSFTISGSVAVTGQQLTLTLGDEVAFTDVTVEVTGQELTMSMGEETPTADANVQLTGVQITSSVGIVDAVVVAEVTGVQMSTSIGSVSITANADVDVTGIQMQTNTGNPAITAWQEIQTGVSNVWTEVDLAA